MLSPQESLSYVPRLAWRLGTICSIAFSVAVAAVDVTAAAGVHYADPGWLHLYDGDEAFYNDPDGPNPDYVNGNDFENEPGGQGGNAALVHPGYEDNCDPNESDECKVDNDAAMWTHESNNWDGSAPGDAFAPGFTPGDPVPIPPPAPGGVATITDGNTTFLRVQDPGGPQGWGYADKGTSACQTCPKQEGNNRKIQFAHEMDQDEGFSGRDGGSQAVIDEGITISFRTRLATAATGPIDDIYIEEGPNFSPGGAPVPWPDDGLGYRVRNEGRGMFYITQTTAIGRQQQMAFSLLDEDTVTFDALPIEGSGLVMNNRADPALGAAGLPSDPDTSEATADSLNLFELPDDELADWHEFWITIAAIELDDNGEAVEDEEYNTHEVNIYHNGSLEPEMFQIILGPENEFGTGAHLGMGLSSGSSQGAYDIDFFAYLEGVVEPTLRMADLVGDYNMNGEVDAPDYNVWRDSFGQMGADLPADGNDDGTVNAPDYNIWRDNFGETLPQAGGASGVPEPSGLLLLLTSLAMAAVQRRRRFMARQFMAL